MGGQPPLLSVPISSLFLGSHCEAQPSGSLSWRSSVTVLSDFFNLLAIALCWAHQRHSVEVLPCGG